MAIEQAEVAGWPGYRIRGDRIEVGVVPCPGGRVASLCHDGEELLFVQPEHRGEPIDLSGDLRARKAELGFRVWGGNKTWVAPQRQWLEAIPPLDLDAGEYRADVEQDAIALTSPACRETGLVVRRRIRIEPDDTLVIDHAFEHSDSTRGLWSVTQWLRPFDVHFIGEPRPYPEEGTTEEVMRAHVDAVGPWTRVRAHNAVKLKLGTRAERGELIALRPSATETLVVRSSFDTDPSATYAHGSSVEVFNSEDYPYLEFELHAPLGEPTFTERIRVERRPGRLAITDL